MVLLRPFPFRLSLLLAVLALPLLPLPEAAAQTHPSGPGGRRPQPAKSVSEAQGRKIIERFRSHRLQGDFFFQFELVQLPRRGAEIPFEGLMWGTWTEQGPLTRVALWEPGAREGTLRQFLILSGQQPRAWQTLPDGSVEELPQGKMIDPLVPQLLYTPFDLAMPFVYWDATYIGPDRVRGRRAQTFLMSAPDEVRQSRPQWDYVMIALDDEYDALLRAEVVNSDNLPLRSFRIRSFKEIGGQYIIRGIDLVDEEVRDKTRFEVQRAAVGLRLPASVFAPASLAGNHLPRIEPIPTEAL